MLRIMKLEQAMSQDPSLEETAPDEERHASNRISLRLCRRLVAQACPNLYNPMAWSPPGSSVHGILQA